MTTWWSRRRRSASFDGPSRPRSTQTGEPFIVVDTSAIIDGRIADIVESGFIFGTLVVPRFVLEELQHIADSSDTMRRARGRRGLEILGRLQKDSPTPVEIADVEFPDVAEVDAKLVALAKQRSRTILTNDFNLNRVAELQGVRVMNINSLANAVKPAVLPGEEMHVKVIQEGKEPGQGVGFLDDGTMVVVEGGGRFIDRELDVAVTRVLQTVAGRIDLRPAEAGVSAPTAFDLVVVAAGASRRMDGIDKLAAPLGGVPLLIRTVASMSSSPGLRRTVVVSSADRVDRSPVGRLAAGRRSDRRRWAAAPGVRGGRRHGDRRAWLTPPRPPPRSS